VTTKPKCLTTFATSRIDELSNRTASSLAHFEHQTPGTLRSVYTILQPHPRSSQRRSLFSSGSSYCVLAYAALSLSPDCRLPVMALARVGAPHSTYVGAISSRSAPTMRQRTNYTIGASNLTARTSGAPHPKNRNHNQPYRYSR